MLEPRLERIDPQEVLRYLGCRDAAPPELVQAVDAGIAELTAAARPRLTYRVFPVSEGQLAGSGLTLEGQDIQRHLSGCREAVVMAATLGAEVETLLLRSQVRDLARSLVLDSAASAAIENVCDCLEADLRREYEVKGLFLTDRYSPGYGDLPLSLQGPLCEALDTRRRMGLTVSASGILIPRKSVTAILGAADTPRKRRSAGCENCAFRDRCAAGLCPAPARDSAP